MSEGTQIPHPVTGRTLGINEVKLVNSIGNIVYSDHRAEHTPHSIPVYVVDGNIHVTATADVQLEGVYDAATNPDPDNVGIIVHANSAAPGDPQQTVRTTGGVSVALITSNTFFGLDTRSKLYATGGHGSETELSSVLIGGADYGLAIGVLDADGDRVTAGEAVDTITSTSFIGMDTRSKLYASDGYSERELSAVTIGGSDYGLATGIYDVSGDRWEITADGYGLVDPITIRGTEDLAALETGAQIMLEARSGQKTAVDSEDAVRAVANLYGEQVNAGYVWATDSNRTERVDDPRYDSPAEVLVDTTNLGAATYYYPSSAGFSMDAYSDLSIQCDLAGGVTLTVEADNESSATANWHDITKAFLDLITNISGTASYVDVDAFLSAENLNAAYVRIKVVTADATNEVRVVIRRKP